MNKVYYNRRNIEKVELMQYVGNGLWEGDIVIEESKMDGCPRCHSHHIKFIKISPNGICNGQINECKDCGQWFNIVADYDKW